MAQLGTNKRTDILRLPRHLTTPLLRRVYKIESTSPYPPTHILTVEDTKTETRYKCSAWGDTTERAVKMFHVWTGGMPLLILGVEQNPDYLEFIKDFKKIEP